VVIWPAGLQPHKTNLLKGLKIPAVFRSATHDQTPDGFAGMTIYGRSMQQLFSGKRGKAMTLKPDRNSRTATRMVHAGTARSPYGEVSEAIYLTQEFCLPDG